MSEPSPARSGSETPVRSFRIADDVYLPALAKSRARGDKLAEIVASALIEYVRDYE